MKPTLYAATVAFLTLFTTNALAQQGFGTNQPDRSAAVDIVSSKRGLLIPRVALTQTNSQSPIVAKPADGLMVYNTATAGDVTPGFYYWVTDRWVRFVSSSTGKTVDVLAGKNVQVDTAPNAKDATITEYTVSVAGGKSDGQVLVTKVDPNDPSKTTTEWIDPADFVAGVIEEGNGITIKKEAGKPSVVELGGALVRPTEIGTSTVNTLAIKGLEQVADTDFDSASQHIMIMGSDGILKVVSAKGLLEDAIDKGGTKAKALKGDGITVTAGETTGTDASVADALLKDVVLGIANGAVTQDKMSAKDLKGAVPADIEGAVPVANADGTVTYKPLAGALGKDLTTDNKIVIGENKVGTLANAVLVPTHLSIKEESITSVDIKNNSIKPEDIEAPGTGTEGGKATPDQVLVTNADGTVTWVSRDQGAKKDTYTGGNQIAVEAKKDADGNPIANANGGVDYTVTLEPGKAGQTLVTKTDADGKNPKAEWVDKGRAPITVNNTQEGDIINNNNYSVDLAEVVIVVTLADKDINLTLPAVSGTEGQTISVKITNTDDGHTGYLNILDGGATLTYGSMPYQGWILKSTGGKWLIAGRN